MNTLSPVPTESDARRGFMRDHWPRLVLISALVTVPCLWHRHFEAGDLASHVYNAWLAQLIQHGQAPGLYIVRQWNNVLFDSTLIGLAKLVGLRTAERIATSAAVLIFFWGSFAFVSFVARRAAWNLIPVIAIFAYGWTFEEGLMNYYVSIGLAFFGLALLRSELRWRKSLGRDSGWLNLARESPRINLFGQCGRLYPYSFSRYRRVPRYCYLRGPCNGFTNSRSFAFLHAAVASSRPLEWQPLWRYLESRTGPIHGRSRPIIALRA